MVLGDANKRGFGPEVGFVVQYGHKGTRDGNAAVSPVCEQAIRKIMREDARSAYICTGPRSKELSEIRKELRMQLVGATGLPYRNGQWVFHNGIFA